MQIASSKIENIALKQLVILNQVSVVSPSTKL
jgi:hypothetical protein